MFPITAGVLAVSVKIQNSTENPILLKTVYLLESTHTLREKCPNEELFLVRIYGVNLRIQSEYRKMETRNNSVFGHFSRSDTAPTSLLDRKTSSQIVNHFCLFPIQISSRI